MYSVCYVLTDQEKLEYYNEMMVSICSLRKQGYGGQVYVLMDGRTKEVIDASGRDEMARFGASAVVVKVPESYSQRIRSRYIKTSIRRWIKGDYLYIDTDTILAEPLPEFISDHDLALALDVNVPFSQMSHKVRGYHNVLQKKAGYGDSYGEELYYNSGVMWVKDTELTHEFYKAWHKNWHRYMTRHGLVEDQPGLNKANIQMGHVIHRLPETYNVQVSGNPFPTQYLAEAKVIHYIHNEAQSTYILSHKDFDKSNLEDPKLLEILEAPKRAFLPGTMMRKDETKEKLLSSPTFRFFEGMYQRLPILYKLMNRVFYYCLMLGDKLKK